MSRSIVSKYPIDQKNTSKLSNPDLFVKNLRLLDLDEDFDWPGIDATTFDARDSVENLDQRLYCAAWVFYKLFELYDEDETRRNLRELFPPIGSEQAFLLRNTIFKWLYKLKVTGFFGKEIAVRKVMFDDCKGSKFEELLAVFSTAVLIKVVERDRQNKCIVQRSIGLAVCPLDIPSLILAYRASLSKHLKTRTVLEKRWHKFARALQSQKELLEQRSQCVEMSSVSKRIPQRTLTNLHAFMSKQWLGDSEWIDVLLQSDQHGSTGSMLDLSFEDVWRYACSDTLYAIRPQQKESCAQRLESKLTEQKARLDKWKTILAANKAKSHTVDRTLMVHEEVPTRKYSLRSYGAPLSTSDSRKVSADDSYLPRGTTQQNTRHRSSKSVSSRITLPDPSATMTPSSMQKPLANTGIRLSSAIPPVAPQDYHTRPNVSHQSIENSPDATPLPFNSNDKIPNEITTYDLYANQSPYRPSLSLAERTKLSMAKRMDNSVVPLTQSNSAESIPRPSVATLGDLAQRTRESMLTRQIHTTILPNQPERKPRTSVNNFGLRETTIATEDSFFDETTIDLDEIDIFKSRPRVAVSPVLTPMAEVGSLPTITADDSYEDDFS